MNGYCGIGIYHSKSQKNIGTLWRSAMLFKASFIYTVGIEFKKNQPTDTYKSWRQVPMLYYNTIEDFIKHLPCESQLIGVELTEDAEDIVEFVHPKRAVYLLGTETTGLPPEVLALCKKVIKLPGKFSMNVSTAGSLVLYDRHLKEKKKKQKIEE